VLTYSDLSRRFPLRPPKQQVPECLSLPPWQVGLFDNHYRRWRWLASQHRSNSSKRLINFADSISVKLPLI
jgi:hypothetical protein